MVINRNTQPFDDLEPVWVPRDVFVTQEMSEGWHPILLWRVDSGIQRHRQRVCRHRLPGLDGGRVFRAQTTQLLRAILDVVEYSLDR